jgi:hypothetical protein
VSFSQHLTLSEYLAQRRVRCSLRPHAGQYDSGAFRSDAAVYTNVTFWLCCLFLPATALYANQTRADVPEIHKNGRNSAAAGIISKSTTTKM